MDKVEEGWNGQCRKNWPKFLRACAIELLDRLPPAAGDWVVQADRYERGELSEVIMFRLLPRKADWTREEYCETCNFVECCIVGGMSNEKLEQLLREHFPSAFEPRPWWKFW